MTKTETLDRLTRDYLVPVVRTQDGAAARRACQRLAAAGMGVFEITLTVPDAFDVIAELAAGGALVGVGTVLTGDDAQRAIEAGARFVVSPATVPEVGAVCAEAGAACLLGALTPTEVLAAVAAGADVVKIFPAGSVGGPAHIHALAAVFPQIPLAPTGGISVDDIPRYRKAGAAFVGIGGTLVADAAAGDLDPAALKARLARLIGADSPSS